MATLKMQVTPGGRFSARDRDTRELVAWAVDTVNKQKNFAELVSCTPKKRDEVEGRMDVTEETSTVAKTGKKRDDLQIAGTKRGRNVCVCDDSQQCN